MTDNDDTKGPVVAAANETADKGPKAGDTRTENGVDQTLVLLERKGDKNSPDQVVWKPSAEYSDLVNGYGWTEK